MGATKHILIRQMASLAIVVYALSNIVFAHDAKESFTFGVVPQQSASKIAEVWGPVMKYLSEKTGHNLIMGTARDTFEFEQRLAQGDYDFAYMNPYEYTVFHQSAGFDALARKGGKMSGIVVVRKDSPYQSMADLKGQTIAVPSSTAFAASILPQVYFAQEKIPVQTKFVRSHDSVYQAVAKGIYPAGGGIPRTLNLMEQEVKDQLRIVWTSKGYTPHAVAARNRVNKQAVTHVQEAIIAMKNDPVGVKLLKQLDIDAFETASDRDWDDVRALGLTLLDDIVKKSEQ